MREYFPWPPEITNRTSAEGALDANGSVVASPHEASDAAVKDGSVGAKRGVHSEIAALNDGTLQILFVILSAVSHARVVDRTELETPDLETPNLETPNIVIQWDNAALQGARDSKIGPPMVARALAIVHTCIYDTWAAYDDRASGTQLGKALRQPYGMRTLENKKEAISFAAYRAVVDLFQLDEATLYHPLMTSLGYDPDNTTTDTTTPAGVGNTACAAVLRYRHNDGSNQNGLMSSSGVPYSDYTGYEPVNPPSTVPVIPTSTLDPNRWQPLQYTDQTGAFVTQVFLGAQWNRVVPFALRSDDQFRAELSSFGPAEYGSTVYREQAEELIELSAKLTDEQKMIAEYWKDGPHSETPSGHWALLAQFVSMRDHHTLDQDVKMFFAVTNATLDASIVAWDAKRAFDSVRPATAILLPLSWATDSVVGRPRKKHRPHGRCGLVTVPAGLIPDPAIS